MGPDGREGARNAPARHGRDLHRHRRALSITAPSSFTRIPTPSKRRALDRHHSRAHRRPLLHHAPRRSHIQHSRWRRNDARFAERMADEPEVLREEAQRCVDEYIRKAEKWATPGQQALGWMASRCAPITASTSARSSARASLRSLLRPIWLKLTKAYRDMGFYVIKHTDGNIMPILDQLLQTKPARAAFARPAGRRGHRRGSSGCRRQGVPDRQRELRHARHRHD